MISEEEFGHLISEFESLRDMVIEETGKIKTELENIKDELNELKAELAGSGKINFSKKI